MDYQYTLILNAITVVLMLYQFPVLLFISTIRHILNEKLSDEEIVEYWSKVQLSRIASAAYKFYTPEEYKEKPVDFVLQVKHIASKPAYFPSFFLLIGPLLFPLFILQSGLIRGDLLLVLDGVLFNGFNIFMLFYALRYTYDINPLKSKS